MEPAIIRRLLDELKAEMRFLNEPLLTAGECAEPDILDARLDDPGWDVYAEGYKKGGDALVQYVIEHRYLRDCLVYPILFLYRQYLELRLKNLIRVSSGLGGGNVDIPLGHGLLELWDEVRQNMTAILMSGSDTESVFEAIGGRLKELDKIDRTSQASRYPQLISREGRGDSELFS
ncbi:MAG: hypothetical protein HYY29_03995 [Chloroflexi bacterium]|nr:hypothetical protein [Chloroflexota bacterium]